MRCATEGLGLSGTGVSDVVVYGALVSGFYFEWKRRRKTVANLPAKVARVADANTNLHSKGGLWSG